MNDDARLEANWRDHQLVEAGLLDEYQPTESDHVAYIERMRAEFAPIERQLIRSLLLPPAGGVS